MDNDIDLENYFKMDRTYFSYISSEEDAIKEKAYWLERSEEERFFAIEFLRNQWIKMNGLPDKMDRKIFDYK